MYLRISSIVLCLLLTHVAAQSRGDKGNPHTFGVDIALDSGRFSRDEAPAHEDGRPAYGAAFIVQGYIYPAGTLDCADGCGALPDGSPEFPDEVIGEWTCWGHFVGEGGLTATGLPGVVTTQLYSFGDEPGAKTLVTTGYELAGFDVPFERSVTGGTGPFQRAAGTQSQRALGQNPSGALNLRVNFNLKRSIQLHQ